MNALDEMRPQPGRHVASRVGGAILAAMIVAACAGENLFTGPALGSGALLGPEVNITAPVPPVTVPSGDSVLVTATIVSSQGVTEVSFTSTLDVGGTAPFSPIVIPLTAVTDTTMSRYMKRSGATTGGAKIIVTAKEAGGNTGADTVAVTLGP
jgi:hypothetical protein